MEIVNALIESQTRERALLTELNAAKLSLAETHGPNELLLQAELTATRLSLSQTQGLLSRALGERDAAIQEKDAAISRERYATAREEEGALRENEFLQRVNEIQRDSTGIVESAVQRGLAAERRRVECEEAQTIANARFARDQRTILLRSPKFVRKVLGIMAQNGFSAHGFKNLSRAFRGDEQLWDTIKDRSGANGWTHLMVAAQGGRAGGVQWLLSRGANVNAANAGVGDTALTMACERGHLHVARLLLDHGANVNAARAVDGVSALLWAAFKGHLELARLLLDKGANADARETSGFTPLMGASQAGHGKVVNLLLARGAKKNLVAGNGQTAASMARTVELRGALM